MIFLNRIAIQPSMYIGLCISLCVLPIQWIVSWFLAAMVHELGHLIALKLLRIPVYRISLGFGGAYIETGFVCNSAEIFAAAAGPFAGALCLLLSESYPLLAICALVQSIYNLFPFPSYDGGRILASLTVLLFPEKIAQKVCQGIQIIFCVALVIAGILFWIALELGMVCLILFIAPVLKSGVIKIPCKRERQIVQ